MIREELLKIHGDGNCHICGKPKAGEGLDICSYPHGMVPVENVTLGMMAWEYPEKQKPTTQ